MFMMRMTPIGTSEARFIGSISFRQLEYRR
jgi:hypothetical protein